MGWSVVCDCRISGHIRLVYDEIFQVISYVFHILVLVIFRLGYYQILYHGKTEKAVVAA